VGIISKVTNKAVVVKPGTEVVAVDPKYYRPTEVDLLIGDPSKAQKQLNWQPEYTLQQLIKEMVASDIELFNREKLLKNAGYSIKNQFE